MAPSPIFSPVEPTAAQTTDTHELSERRVDAGHGARLPALSDPDREIVLSRGAAGVFIPDIVATLGVTPAAVGLAQHQALGTLRPAATANGPPPEIRKRVVLLPHARAEPTDTRLNNRSTGRGAGMDQDDPSRCDPTQRDGVTGASITSGQWHDVELAMKVARHSFESWLVAGHEDTPSLAVMHAYRTHAALHEAARAITTLIETFRAEASARITSPLHGTEIPAQRR